MEPVQFSTPTINLDEEDYQKIREVLESGWVSIGKYVEELENEFKRRFKVKHAIACSCATQGLVISLKAAGWRNKRIAVPAFTWPSTIFALESNIGNTPVFCDIDPETWLVDTETLADDAYDAVLGVDTFGNQASIETKKPIIYDAAHGFDLENLGHRGIAEVVSFSFTKVVSASEGGMILTNYDEIAQTAYELRRLSSRMEEINAIIALSSIRKYEHYQKLKRETIKKYLDGFDFIFNVQKIPECTNHSVFTLLLNNTYMRDAIVAGLCKNNIEHKIYYEPLVEGLSNTDQIFSRIVSLPTHPGMASKVEEVVEVVNQSVTGCLEKQKEGRSNYQLPGKAYLLESGYLINYLRRENRTST